MNRDHYVAGQRLDWRGAADRRRNSVREPDEHSNIVCFIFGALLTSIAWIAAMGLHA